MCEQLKFISPFTIRILVVVKVLRDYSIATLGGAVRVTCALSGTVAVQSCWFTVHFCRNVTNIYHTSEVSL